MKPSRGPRVVVLGTMGSVPFAGMAWQVLHHVEGFRRAGCDVHYLEDSGHWIYDPLTDTPTDDPSYAVRFIAAAMAWCNLRGRWTYRAVTDGEPTYGHTQRELRDLLASADVIVNLTGSTELREEHMAVPVRVFLETDPGLPQFQVAKGERGAIDYLDAHTHHVTYASNIGGEDCELPAVPYEYITTVPPVIVDWWTARAPADDQPFTTVANFRQSGKDIEFNGEVFTWSKHHQFLRLLDLPRRVRRPIELALSSLTPDDETLLRQHGWRVIDGLKLSTDFLRYQSYITRSAGEFSVAKDQVVRPRTGWFSDRSVCYLAAGRPVIVQDTGIGRIVPTGEGLLVFQDIDDAVAAFEDIDAAPDRHARTARDLADGVFRAETVLAQLLRGVGVGVA